MPLRSFHIPHRHAPEEIDAMFARQRREDPVGVPIHVGCALIACFLAGWPTSVVDWAGLAVLVCFLVRMTGWHGMLEPLAYDRVIWALLAWGAWAGLSVAWSYSRLHGGREWVGDIQTLRFWAFPLLLWPAIDRRRWLVLALMAGIACGEMSQLVHLLATRMDWNWIPFHRMPGRMSGWWDPVVGGSVLCAGLGLWVGAVLFGVGRVRAAGAAGALVTLTCIGLTGTRGAWIAAGMLSLLAVAMACRYAPTRRNTWIAGSLGVAALVAAALVVVVALGATHTGVLGALGTRVRAGVDEVRAAMHGHGYDTDTGLRLAMWRWGAAAVRTHPLEGVGAGGYQPWVRAQTADSAAALGGPAEAIPLVHAHAHSWYIHTAATFGLVGLGLLAWLIVSAVRSGLAARRTAAGTLVHWTDRAPALGLLGLACAGLFDSITVNQQTAYIFYVLVALSLPSRPRDISAVSRTSGDAA